MRGLMQDFPLTIDAIFRHAETHHGDTTIATAGPRRDHPGAPTRSGRSGRGSFGGVLDTLGRQFRRPGGHVRLEQPAAPSSSTSPRRAPAACCTR